MHKWLTKQNFNPPEFLDLSFNESSESDAFLQLYAGFDHFSCCESFLRVVSHHASEQFLEVGTIPICSDPG